MTLLVAASLVSERLLPAAVGVAGGFWIIRWVANGCPSVRTPADWAIALLVLMIPVTLWATALPGMTQPQVYRLLTGIALFYAIANWADSRARLGWILAGITSAGLTLALMSTVSVEWFTTKLPFIPASFYDRFTLLVADTIHPNVMAGSLVILIPVALGWLLFSWRNLGLLERTLVGVAVTLMAGVIVLTQSRGGWMAFGAVLITMILLRWRRGWIVLPALAVVVIVAIYTYGISGILEALSTSGTIRGIDGRVEIWSRAVYMVQDFPFTGIGLGSFGDVADVLYPFFLAGPGSVPHAHNLFLQVAVDLGLPGLIAWLAVLSVVTVTAWRVYQHGRLSQDGWIAGLGAGLLSSQLALGVHGVTDAVTWGMVRPAPIVWVLWGLAVASSRVFIFTSESLATSQLIEKVEIVRESEITEIG